MVICKFFLQGTCKFGQNCKFDHQINDRTNSHGGSILRQQVGANIDTTTLIRSVQNDMVNAEKGGQWLLSSYAPFKDKLAFPGFEDRSFEEVRLGFYEATKNGSVDQYKHQLKIALQESANRIKALQQPSQDLVNVLTQIYNGNSSFTTGTFPTNTSQSKNVFGQTNQQTGFSQTQQSSQSIFAAANQSHFPSQPQQSIFSRSPTNVFASVAPSPNQSIFGSALPTPSSVFTGQSYATSNSPFGVQTTVPLNVPQPNSQFRTQTTSSLSAPQTSSPFGVQTTSSPLSVPQTSSPFQMNTNNSPFGGNFSSTTPSFLAQQQNQSTSIFGQSPLMEQKQSPVVPQQAQTFPAQQQTSPFGNQHSVFTPFQQSTSIFNSQSVANKNVDVFQQSGNSDSGSVFGSTNSTVIENFNQSLYSKLEDLSESDVKSFESDHFEFGKIPVKPPTVHMCF